MTDNNNSELLKEEKPFPFIFSLTCPHCQKTLIPSDFDNNHFTIAHPHLTSIQRILL